MSTCYDVQLLALSRRLLGARLFRALMRSTFFGHFVAGENAQEVAPVVARLHSGGVRAILDYAAESDIHSSPATDTRCGQRAFQSRSRFPLML